MHVVLHSNSYKMHKVTQSPSNVSKMYFMVAQASYVALPFHGRSRWASEDDPCHQKLPFFLWVLMKSEGTAQDMDAKHVLEKCLQSSEVNLLELITPEVSYTVAYEKSPANQLSRNEPRVVGRRARISKLYLRLRKRL